MRLGISVIALFSTLVFADIVVKPDGTITCTGGCTGTITGSTITMCQGSTCVTMSTNPPPKQIQKPPKDDL
jgi:hypothetical protein